MDIRSIMTPSPACCTRDTSLRDVAVRTVARGINPLDVTAGDCMSEPVVTVTPQTSLADCCRVMEQHKVRRVPVVDDAGAICGIVALADVALQGRDKTVADVVKEVSEPAC